jgi:hypothetical protein
VRWLCLMVGFNNFGTGRGAIAALVAAVESDLQSAGGTVIASFGSTGNTAVETMPTVEAKVIRETLERVSGSQWAVVEWWKFEEALTSLDQLALPAPLPGMRWTPGLSFALDPPNPPAPIVVPTPRGRFTAVEPGVVAIHKYDIEDERGRLDFNRRNGGWGALSTDIARQLGGRVTSRARSTLLRLHDRARPALTRAATAQTPLLGL